MQELQSIVERRSAYFVILVPLISTQRVPEATSFFNMATQGGVGIIVASVRGIGLYTGYRFTHISNGGAASRNPGWNVHGIVIGSRLVAP